MEPRRFRWRSSESGLEKKDAVMTDDDDDDDDEEEEDDDEDSEPSGCGSVWFVGGSSISLACTDKSISTDAIPSSFFPPPAATSSSCQCRATRPATVR